ncbi:hypothetical protein MTR_3g116760 [Medicago truncatula]|uniref:Uncharacterized protein n=1 Tax=Medicago truncatula TaxID=3880 RepID=G7J736_MEDTR|nr:hypothetical protein MTR_3g116760 [Medicago truncatula]
MSRDTSSSDMLDLKNRELTRGRTHMGEDIEYYGVKGRLRFAATGTVPRGGVISNGSQSPQTRYRNTSLFFNQLSTMSFF